MTDDASCPTGPVFPSLRRSPIRRRWRLSVLAVVLLAGAAIVWPVFPKVASIRPYVLGLPFSLAWVVGALVVVFVAMGTLYYREEVAQDVSDTPGD